MADQAYPNLERKRELTKIDKNVRAVVRIVNSYGVSVGARLVRPAPRSPSPWHAGRIYGRAGVFENHK